MFDDLRGQVAVVTGGARGLGYSMATALAGQGVDVALVDVLDDVEASAQRLQADSGVRSIGVRVDVTSLEDVEACFAAVVERLGRPSILVNAAGIVIWDDSARGPIENWRKVVDVNLTGTYQTCRVFGRLALDAGAGGAIVNVSSMSATVVNVPQHQTSYHASKAGVDMVTKSLAVEWARNGIRVNAIAPGYMLSDMTRQFTVENPELAAQWNELTPMGRMGEPEDLHGLVLLLCSSASSYLTGQSIVIDGGYTLI